MRGSAVDRGVKGGNSFRLGVYRLRLQPKDGARNVGRVRTTRAFRIVRR